jgi:hypothetical protein
MDTWPRETFVVADVTCWTEFWNSVNRTTKSFLTRWVIWALLGCAGAHVSGGTGDAVPLAGDAIGVIGDPGGVVVTLTLRF